MQKIDYIRKGYHAITPALAIKDAGRAISWYKKIFGAQEIACLKNPDGTIAHAELTISGSALMLAEENPDYNQSPGTLKGTAVILHLYVPDADIVFSQATKEGAEIIFPLQDQFYGDRSGRIKDPFGYLWTIASIKEEITSEEVNKRFKEWISQNA
jgi:PhnB protein